MSKPLRLFFFVLSILRFRADWPRITCSSHMLPPQNIEDPTIIQSNPSTSSFAHICVNYSITLDARGTPTQWRMVRVSMSSNSTFNVNLLVRFGLGHPYGRIPFVSRSLFVSSVSCFASKFTLTSFVCLAVHCTLRGSLTYRHLASRDSDSSPLSLRRYYCRF
jgi:hypothetical protein